MGIITKVTRKDDIAVFKPVILNVQITIDSKESLKELQSEFKLANLNTYHIQGGEDNDSLRLIGIIVEEIEKAL